MTRSGQVGTRKAEASETWSRWATGTTTSVRARRRPGGGAAEREIRVTRSLEQAPQTLAETWTLWALLVLRVGAGLLFMQHGAQKLFGLFGGFGPDGGTAQFLSQMGLAGVLEFFGGAAIVLGLLTRPIAVLLAAEMVWAFVQAHLPGGGFPIQNGGELPLLYALVFLFLAARGAGPVSVDAKVSDRTARI